MRIRWSGAELRYTKSRTDVRLAMAGSGGEVVGMESLCWKRFAGSRLARQRLWWGVQQLWSAASYGEWS